MKFKEEVFAKIFTYVTVILLLCVVIFEAWSLQNERADLKEERENAASIQKNLDTMISMNTTLQEENRELQIFQNTWLPYAAFTDSSEILALKTDLFTRPGLIPKEALEDALEYSMKTEADDGEEDADSAKEEQDASGKKTQESSDKDAQDESRNEEEEETEEERKLEFQFDNPDGEDIFLPLSIDSAELQSCLVYTVAFEKTEDISIELIYEITFEDGNNAVRDDNGEIEWNCIAYNAGNGWNGTEGEQNDRD